MTRSPVDYTVVIPVYYNAGSLRELVDGLYRDLFAALPTRKGRLLFVDDGSGDDSWTVLQALQIEHPDVIRIVKFSRNFGQVNAWWCGLSLAEGAAVVMSADGQDTPANAARLLGEHFDKRVEVVIATRRSRDESSYRQKTSQLSYWLMKRLSFAEMPTGGFDFFVLGPKARVELLKCYHYHGFVQGQILRLGFSRSFVACDRQARSHGVSRWTFSKKLTYLLDGVLGYSFVPIRMMSITGALVAFLGFAYAALIIVLKIFWGHAVEGWTPLMIVVLCMGGVQMLMLGMLGEYLWRTFAQVRGSAPYIIDEIVGADSDA